MKRSFQIRVAPSQTESDTIKHIRSFNENYKKSEQTGTTPLDYRSGKNHLFISDKKGQSLDTCATIKKDYVCCNVKVLKSVKNCPYDCSYCFLQYYLNDGETSVTADIDGLLEEVEERLKQQPWRFFRIGTWELGDSLALEEAVGQAQQLIPRFAKLNNVVLELKTKSDCVQSILNLDHQGKTVVSWSLNTDYIIKNEEHRTASLANRLKAIRLTSEAGYLIGLHFDPMIWYENWELDYTKLIEALALHLNPKMIAWISIGSLRFNPEMKQKITMNFPNQKLVFKEMVTGDDRKMRYPKPIRKQMYSHLYKELTQYIKVKDLSPIHTEQANPLLYFCMERWDVWEAIMGENNSPSSIGELDYLFAKNFYTRFPNLGLSKPIQNNYIENEDT